MNRNRLELVWPNKETLIFGQERIEQKRVKGYRLTGKHIRESHS